MFSENEAFYDFSHIVAEEVEIESTEVSANGNSIENISKQKDQQPIVFEAADYHNGAIYDDLNYCWSQTFTEIGKS